jgi:tRNA A37 methylthiotransferase MiaB
MQAHKKVAFYTLGCKLNFSETSTIARNFQNEGFERVGFEEAADIMSSTPVLSQKMQTNALKPS